MSDISLSEKMLKKAYEDHMASFGDADKMPKYEELSDAYLALWRAINELTEEDIQNTIEGLCDGI